MASVASRHASSVLILAQRIRIAHAVVETGNRRAQRHGFSR